MGVDDKKEKKSSENDQLTGHFQSVFFIFLISPEKKNSKTSKVNLNL